MDKVVSVNCLIEGHSIQVKLFVANWLTTAVILGVPFKEMFKDMALEVVAREVPLITIDKRLQLVGANRAMHDLIIY